jgi:RNA polymerase sigma factor (sigma-70 family)
MNVPEGESGSQEAVFLEHLPVARTIATSIWSRLSARVQFEDLMQAASVGLWNAINTFDSSASVPVKCYVKFCVRGAILDHLNSLSEQNHSEPEKSEAQRKEPSRLKTTQELVSVQA